MADSGRLRIGELSRRVGESPELLRAWESRYGLVEPERTSGGLRLYSDQDERRIRVMRQHINAGLSAAEAARLAKQAEGSDGGAQSLRPVDVDAALQRSFDALDEPAAQATLDRLLTTFGLRRALGEVILPFLNGLGERWATAQTSVAQEHFASNIIGGRLRSLAQGWGQGVGPRAVLACPPGELHELGLLAFGLALRERGWRITYLGADTPLQDIVTLGELAPAPAIVVLAAVDERRFMDSAEEIKDLAAQCRLGIAGAGATPEVARSLGVESLAGELLAVAEKLAP